MNTTTGLAVAGVGMAALGIVWVVTHSGPGCPAGQVAIKIIAQGPGTVDAGGEAQPHNGSATICPNKGDSIQYSANPDPGHSFVRWEGPGGITTTQNPFVANADTPGFVRGVFS